MSSALAPSLLIPLFHRPGFWIALLAGLPLLIGGLYVSVDWIGSRQLKRTVARLEGEGFNPSEPPTVSAGVADADNFCATPLMRSIAEGRAGGASWDGANRILKWDRAAAKQGIYPRSMNRPAPTDWDALYAVPRESYPLSLVGVEINPAAFLRTWIDGELDPVTTELRSVLDRPHAVFVPGYLESAARSPGMTAPTLDYSSVFLLGKAYRQRAELAMADRDAQAFLETIRLLGRLAQACRTEAPIMGAITASGALNLALEATWSATADQAFASADWRRLSDFWRDQRPLESMEAVCRTEIAFGHRAHAHWRTQRAEYLEMMMNHLGGLSRWEKRVGRLTPPGWFDAAHAEWLTEAQALIHRLGDPSIPDRYNVNDWLDQRVDDAQFPSLRVGVRPLSVFTSVRSIAAVHATARLAEAACALEAYTAENESPPDTLDALVPRYLAAVPLDLDGRPIRYAPMGASGRYKLWSIGSDGVDDGGAGKGGSREWFNPKGDWVWEYPP